MWWRELFFPCAPWQKSGVTRVSAHACFLYQLTASLYRQRGKGKEPVEHHVWDWDSHRGTTFCGTACFKILVITNTFMLAMFGKALWNTMEKQTQNSSIHKRLPSSEILTGGFSFRLNPKLVLQQPFTFKDNFIFLFFFWLTRNRGLFFMAIHCLVAYCFQN